MPVAIFVRLPCVPPVIVKLVVFPATDSCLKTWLAERVIGDSPFSFFP